MNNEELINSLSDRHMLSLIELLSRALRMPEENIQYLAYKELSSDLSLDVVGFCRFLTDYQRLKLMQLLVNTLVAEVEKAGVTDPQALLFLKTGD